MNEKILKKEQINQLHEDLARYYNFYAPIKVKGNIVFKKISNPEEIEIDYLNSKTPPKEILFPRMETLFSYDIDGKKIEIKQRTDLEEKNIIFGIRPCDAYSFNLMENFFNSGEFKDDLFLKKRKNTIIIGLGCNSPRATCFCTSLDYNGHPHRKDDVDIFLTDLGDKYLVDPISNKGRAIVDKLTWLSEASKKDIQKAEDLSVKAESMMSLKLDLKTIAEKLEPNFNHSLWKDVSENCLGCGTCTFFCPTCTCFDVVEEVDHYKKRGKRVRLWDTCQFCLYTLETSGHNPRNTKIERCRNRVLHKFSFYPKNYNVIGCVGCGRCVFLCPVNNDLRDIIKKINNIKKNSKKEEVIIA
ncbi:MAG: 4Fe-4S dicluster domain-containing protein [Promethearchaeota archaeon]